MHSHSKGHMATKAKKGTLAELSEQVPAQRTLSVRVVRVEGKGAARKVFHEPRRVTVYTLSITDLGRFGMALAPLVTLTEGAQLNIDEPVYQAVADVIGWDVADVGAICAPDFSALMEAIVDINSDFFTRPRAKGELEIPTKTAGDNGAGTTQSYSSKPPAVPNPGGSH